MERLEIEPHKYSQLIFDKERDNRTKTVSSTNGPGISINLQAKKKKKNLDSDFAPFIQITQNGSKWTWGKTQNHKTLRR